MHIYSVTDPEFRSYGSVLEGYDTDELLAAMETFPRKSIALSRIADRERVRLACRMPNSTFFRAVIQGKRA